MRSPPRPPDLTPISNAQIELGRQSMELAREQLGISREQFDFFRAQSLEELGFAREQAAQMLGLQERALAAGEQANAISGRVANAQVGLMDQARDFASRDRARWESTFVPLQDRFIADAEGFNTEARREMEAGRAVADVQRMAEAQRSNADARLASMGLDPSQFRSASIANMMGAQTAAAGALQANNARRGVEDKGRALRADAINLGMGLPAQATQAIGVSSGAGANASGAAAQGAGALTGGIGTAAGLSSGAANLRGGALGNMGALTGSPTQWASMGQGSMSMAGNMFNNAGSTMTQNFSNQMSRYNAQQQGMSNMLGLAAGAVGMFAEGGEVRGYTQGGGVEAEDPFALPTLERMSLSMDGYAKDDAKAISRDLGKAADRLRAPLTSGLQPRPSMRDRFKAGMDRFEAGMDRFERGRARMGEPVYDVEVQQILRPIAMAEGGRMQGAIPKRQARDTVPALLAEGEYVIPEDVVRAVGIEKLDKMVAKYHRPGA